MSRMDVMKNCMVRHNFLEEFYITSLIIKRDTQARLLISISLFCVFLPMPLVAFAQVSRTDAVIVRDHIYKGNSLMQRHNYDGAIAEYEQALLLDPMNSSAKDNIVLTHNNWGIDLFHHNKYEDAREQWNTALKLNPADRNAKQNLNVLKAQLAKLGLSATPNPNSGGNHSGAEGDLKPGTSVLPKGTQEAKEDNTPIPNAVIIGHPSSGANVAPASNSFSNGSATVTTGGGNAFNSTPSSGAASASGSLPGNAAVGGAVVIPRTNPYATDPPVSATPVTSPPAPRPVAPVSQVYSAPPSVFSSTSVSAVNDGSSNSSLGTANLEDKLAALENKVYGRSSKDVPILQRLERLERDTSSRASFGSINDRVQSLIKTYGL